LKSPPVAVNVLNRSASCPTAVFRMPLILTNIAPAPTAVLDSPLLRASVPPPQPVLNLAVVSEKSDRQPIPEFAEAVVVRNRESSPSAVLKLGYPPSGGGRIACICGANAKHTRMSGTRRKPRHNGSERPGSRPHEANVLT